MDGNKDYENFLERMDSVDWTIDESMLDSDVEESIEHHGVKGMKWGVRRYQPYPKGQRNAGKFIDASKNQGGSSQNGNKVSGVKGALRSKGREISMVAAQREIKNLTTKDAQTVLSRAQLENRFKRLSSTPNVGTAKSKEEYLNRENMSNQELKRKVDRLQLADNMRVESRKANQEAIDMGKKIAAIAAPIALQVALHGGVDKKWLDRTLNPAVAINDWDKIGKQAAKSLDKLF